jgi:hypothetical protein
MTDKEKRDLHTDTILTHINIVKDLCYQMGIPELGQSHDVSKFSPDEFEIYTYANGKKSPHDIARDKLGVSPSWIHHKARNPHHWEYWTDFNSATPNDDGTFTIICKCVKMPYERIIEMFCDFVGAGKAYTKDAWTVNTPLDYWVNNCEGQRAMHLDSEKLIKKLLTTLSEKENLDDFVAWYNVNKEKLQKNY